MADGIITRLNQQVTADGGSRILQSSALCFPHFGCETLGPTERCTPPLRNETTQRVEVQQGWADLMPPGMVSKGLSGLFEVMTFGLRHKEREKPRSEGRAFQAEGIASAKSLG